MNINNTKSFYNNFTDLFIKYYGNTLQVHSPNNMKDYLSNLIKRIGIKDNMLLLDVGCGVCGPAIYFAKKKKIKIDAINLSDYQIKIGEKNIKTERLENNIRIHEMDYHHLNKEVLQSKYDVVYFFESLGHTDQYEQVIKGISNIVKENGILYIKDLFSLNLDGGENIEITKEREDYYNYKPIILHKLLESLFVNRFRIEFIEHNNLKLNDNALQGFVKELGFPDGGKETGYWLEIKAIKY